MKEFKVLVEVHLSGYVTIEAYSAEEAELMAEMLTVDQLSGKMGADDKVEVMLSAEVDDPDDNRSEADENAAAGFPDHLNKK